MGDLIQIRQMTHDDIEMVHHVFNENSIKKPKEYILKCWEENKTGARITLIAFYEGQFEKFTSSFNFALSIFC